MRWFCLGAVACTAPASLNPRGPGGGQNLTGTEDPSETNPPAYPTDDDSTDTLPTDSGEPATEFGVDVFWTANFPRSSVSVRIADPEGRTDWLFGLAETEAGAAGWFGEDCFVGTGSVALCHPIPGRRLELHQGAFDEVAEGERTLLWSDMNLTYFLEDSEGACWVWGHDPSYYDGLGCEILENHRTGWVRRQGCSGFSPADPAPLGSRVALTFDDGPHPVVTPDILATLRAYDVPATFFMVGENVEAYPDIVQDILGDSRFDVANHSFDHPNLAAISDQEALDQVEMTHQALVDAGANPLFFRFPFGGAHCRIADRVRDEFGYQIAGWHADTADWCYASGGTCSSAEYWRVPAAYASDMRGFLRDQLTRFDGGIVLLHDIHTNTADTLSDILDDIADLGMTIVPLTDLQTFPRLNQGDPYDFPWVGESCDPSADTCWQIEWRSVCEATNNGDGVCVLPCGRDSQCVDRDGGAPLRCVDADQGSEGTCLAQAKDVNDVCADVPGTYADGLPAFATSDGSGADVCVPGPW
ncbi:MAG: polysaccharide deacetylase family protein [Myxococcota bacterium]